MEAEKGESSSAIPLPDIKDALQKKEIEKELARVEEEKEQSRPKIKRSDKEAFAKVNKIFLGKVLLSASLQTYSTCSRLPKHSS